MTEFITGELFKKMVINASTAIEINKQEINDLNVFPVPDGDTGTNMSLTVTAAEKALTNMTPGTLSYVADATASAMLRGARGNSGVILSLLFRGFSRSLKDVDEASASQYANALTLGVESAYKAVMKPAEGTILTVSRLAANAAVEEAKKESDIEKVITKAIEVGYIALADTINQNPVLKKAGVIDSGGKGYLYMLEGMLSAIRGEMLEKITTESEGADKADFSQYNSEDIKFAYCTEFMVERKNNNNANRLRDFLDIRGDSVVVVDDDEIIKVHVHTNDPGVVLTEALTYGAFISVKIDCMLVQHSEAMSFAQPAEVVSVAAQPEPVEKKDFGFVSVCMGAGMEAIFHDLGVDAIISGGQTMNPSTEDILEKITATPSNTVFVLPNNKNIIMAAEQCMPLSDKHVVVIPTKSIPQGVAAMLAVDGVSDVNEMVSLMATAARRIHTAHVTTAARSSVFDNTKIKKGSHLALLDDNLAAHGTDFECVISAVAEKLKELNPEFITIYAGIEASASEAEIVEKILTSAIPDTEAILISGGQAVYRYIISAE